MTLSDTTIWVIIIALAIGTFLLRFSFLGFLGDREMPGWALKLLRYTATAVFPAIVAPLVIFPPATGGQIDPARFMAALVVVVLAIMTRNVLAALAGGVATLYFMLWAIG